MDRISYIKGKYRVLDYARDVLGLPVRYPGDRCTSIMPGPHKTKNAFVVYDDWWWDFSGGIGGDVIDLCAVTKHNGDKGAAIRELAGDYGYSADWIEYTQELGDKIAYFHSQLRESDMRYLYRRGIKKETVERLQIGYDEETDRLILPYWKNGYVAYYVGRDRSGNPDAAKYKKDKLDGLNENIPWGLHTFTPKHREWVERNTEQAVSIDSKEGEIDKRGVSKLPPSVSAEILKKFCIITEGAFDALSFEQEGFKVLSPISGYFSKDALKQVISLCKTQECVFICFDNDTAGTKFQVNMAQMLFQHRIKFVCGTIPDGYKDISEYYEAGGSLFELVQSAKPGISMLASRITERDDLRDFVYRAARYVDKADLVELFENLSQFPKAWLSTVLQEALRPPAEKLIVQELLRKRSLKYVENLGFYEYTHGVWQRRADNLIKGYLSHLLGHWTSGTKLSSLIGLLKSESTTEEKFNQHAIFNFRNCVLDLETGEQKEHSEVYMSTVQAEYDYDPKADCPLFKKFISEIMDGRELSILLLQEMCGYILYSDSSLQKCFFLQGDGANGKSVLLNTLRRVIGEANVSNVEMSSLVEPFQRISLMTSLVNISTETSSNVKGAESLFKQIVVGDEINGCYKNKDFVNFRPRCVMISACNEYIKTLDTTDGFLRRIIFIDFPCKFTGSKADPNLEEKLKAELAAIFNWCYEGYLRLRKQKHFTETPEQQEMMKEFVEIVSPIVAFINDELTDYTGRLTRGAMYKLYVGWCKDTGHTNPMTQNNFTMKFRKQAKQMLPHMTERKSGDGRYYEFPFRPISDSLRRLGEGTGALED